MAQTYEYSIAIPLGDGRMVIAAPRPEDKDRLEQFNEQTLTISNSPDADTIGHAFGSDVIVDVEGHAMTLRLPTMDDAEALRRALAVGAITATIVAAGAIAALQGSPVSTSTQTVTRPVPQAAPMTDFQTRKEAQTDRMLEAPAGQMPMSDSPGTTRGGPQD